MRAHHYSPRTETAYVDCIRPFMLFHGNRLPRSDGRTGRSLAFLSWLATDRAVSAQHAESGIGGSAASVRPSVATRVGLD
jgi:hypothetical protein